MFRTNRLVLAVALGLGAIPHAIQAQTRRVDVDVTAVELVPGRTYDSSRLFLVDRNGNKHVFPSGTFKSENGAAIIILDGRVTTVGTREGRQVKIEGARVARANVSLIGTSGDPALIPDGIFANADGNVIVVERGVITQAIIVVTGN